MKSKHEPAYDKGAELGVIAAIVATHDNGRLYAEVSEIINSHDFYARGNKLAFEAIGSIVARGEVVDSVLLAEELKHAGNLEAVGGYAYVSQLQEAGQLDVPSYMAAKHAAVVKEKALLREIQAAAEALIVEAYEERHSQAIAAKFIEKLASLSAERKAGYVEHVKNLALKVHAEAEERGSRNAYMSGFSTGFRNLDHVMKGLRNKDFIILAARPSVGKSALAGNIAVNVAFRGKKVLFFSLEMSGKALTRRFLAYRSRLKASRIETGRLDADDGWKKLKDAMQNVSGTSIKICEDFALSPAKLIMRAREEKTQHGLDLIVIDYLQLMRTDTRREKRELDISEISRSLKSIAKELDIPVLALSQLNRDVEKRNSRRPILSDLRESGTLEQDADIVMFLWREKDESEKVILSVAKNRDGATGDVSLYFDRDTVSFFDASPMTATEVLEARARGYQHE